jgi:hypothetical protein
MTLNSILFSNGYYLLCSGENLLFIRPYSIHLSNKLPAYVCAYIDTVTRADYTTWGIELLIVCTTIWSLAIQHLYIL